MQDQKPGSRGFLESLLFSEYIYIVVFNVFAVCRMPTFRKLDLSYGIIIQDFNVLHYPFFNPCAYYFETP